MRAVESASSAFRLVPAACGPAFSEALLAVAADEGATLVLPTVTEELPIVARMRQAFRARGMAVCVSDPPGIDIANDKLLTAEELARRGLAVPRTCSGATPAAEATRALGLPLLSKPRVGRGGRGVLVHGSEADLARVESADVVWQEFLPGEEFDVNLFVDRGNVAPTVVVLRKTALKDGVVGNALAVERATQPEVAALGIRAARALGLEGPINIDIRLRSDGAPAVLDVNARVGANVLAAREVLDALEEAWRNGRCV